VACFSSVFRATERPIVAARLPLEAAAPGGKDFPVRKSCGSFLVAWLAFQWGLGAADFRHLKVRHIPEQPKSGVAVRISATGTALAGQRALTLEYQVVDPGRYIELKDPAYARSWVSVAMNDEGREGDAFKGDGILTVELPASLQQPRRLVRYRISGAGRVVAPEATDAEPNYAYFVYDGVPAWRGAIDPRGSDPELNASVTFSPEVLGSVQVYQFIAKKSSVENTTWFQPTDYRDDEGRHQYRYTGTIVAGGKVYDHVRYRARGGERRHAMGKNMWKFDFSRGHHLQACDDFGRPYLTKWEKLNLGACIQQASSHRRGEHGLYEAVTYRLFNLAGVPAPRTHYVHLRIVDEAEETPASQYQGDFWGLYLATEEIDGNFLGEHGLPDGNLFKWDFGLPKPEHFAAGAPTNRQDVFEFVAAYQRPEPDDWWRRNVDLPRYFS
jgi:hypothetical protein